ncbi:MAG: DNA primase [Vampirovibrionales bacterium]
MMMRFISFNEAIQTVKQHLQIEEVIGKFVRLKKKGRHYSGLCPFHNENTPSFVVSPEKGLYKCFGCGASGDAIKFIQEIESKSFYEVIQETTEELGLHIERSTQEDKQARATALDEQQKLVVLNETAWTFFQQQLQGPHGEVCRGYLAGRHYDTEFCKQVGLGVALDAWDALTTHLLTVLPWLQETPQLMETAGLAGLRQSGQGYYDKFRDRLIIPIHDARNRVVAFGGRTLSAEGQPKYLNSPETPVYQKSQLLYGYPMARDAIRRNKRAVVMEGYFDVLRSHQAGLQEAVATCGTALTEEHIKLLFKTGIETLVLCFDADKAGQQATLNALDKLAPFLQRNPIKVRIVRLPNGKDPDDFFTQHTLEHFNQLVGNSPDGLRFQLDLALSGVDVHHPEHQVDAVRRLLPLLANVHQPLVQSQLMTHYASVLHISEETLRLELKRYQGVQQSQLSSSGTRGNSNGLTNQGGYASSGLKHTQPRQGSWNAQPTTHENFDELRQTLAKRNDDFALERQLLAMALSSQSLLAHVTPTLLELPWQHAPLAELWYLIASVEGDSPAERLTLAQTLIETDDLRQLLVDVGMDAEHWHESLASSKSTPLLAFNQMLKRWQQRQRQRELVEQNQQFRQQEQRQFQAADVAAGEAAMNTDPEDTPPAELWVDAPPDEVASLPPPSLEETALDLHYQVLEHKLNEEPV